MITPTQDSSQLPASDLYVEIIQASPYQAREIEQEGIDPKKKKIAAEFIQHIFGEDEPRNCSPTCQSLRDRVRALSEHARNILFMRLATLKQNVLLIPSAQQKLPVYWQELPLATLDFHLAQHKGAYPDSYARILSAFSPNNVNALNQMPLLKEKLIKSLGQSIGLPNITPKASQYDEYEKLVQQIHKQDVMEDHADETLRQELRACIKQARKQLICKLPYSCFVELFRGLDKKINDSKIDFETFLELKSQGDVSSRVEFLERICKSHQSEYPFNWSARAIYALLALIESTPHASVDFLSIKLELMLILCKKAKRAPFHNELYSKVLNLFMTLATHQQKSAESFNINSDQAFHKLMTFYKSFHEELGISFPNPLFLFKNFPLSYKIQAKIALFLESCKQTTWRNAWIQATFPLTPEWKKAIERDRKLLEDLLLLMGSSSTKIKPASTALKESLLFLLSESMKQMPHSHLPMRTHILSLIQFDNTNPPNDAYIRIVRDLLEHTKHTFNFKGYAEKGLTIDKHIRSLEGTLKRARDTWVSLRTLAEAIKKIINSKSSVSYDSLFHELANKHLPLFNQLTINCIPLIFRYIKGRNSGQLSKFYKENKYDQLFPAFIKHLSLCELTETEQMLDLHFPSQMKKEKEILQTQIATRRTTLLDRTSSGPLSPQNNRLLNEQHIEAFYGEIKTEVIKFIEEWLAYGKKHLHLSEEALLSKVSNLLPSTQAKTSSTPSTLVAYSELKTWIASCSGSPQHYFNEPSKYQERLNNLLKPSLQHLFAGNQTHDFVPAMKKLFNAVKTTERTRIQQDPEGLRDPLPFTFIDIILEAFKNHDTHLSELLEVITHCLIQMQEVKTLEDKALKEKTNRLNDILETKWRSLPPTKIKNLIMDLIHANLFKGGFNALFPFCTFEELRSHLEKLCHAISKDEEIETIVKKMKGNPDWYKWRIYYLGQFLSSYISKVENNPSDLSHTRKLPDLDFHLILKATKQLVAAHKALDPAPSNGLEFCAFLASKLTVRGSRLFGEVKSTSGLINEIQKNEEGNPSSEDPGALLTKEQEVAFLQMIHAILDHIEPSSIHGPYLHGSVGHLLTPYLLYYPHTFDGYKAILNKFFAHGIFSPEVLYPSYFSSLLYLRDILDTFGIYNHDQDLYAQVQLMYPTFLNFVTCYKNAVVHQNSPTATQKLNADSLLDCIRLLIIYAQWVRYAVCTPQLSLLERARIDTYLIFLEVVKSPHFLKSPGYYLDIMSELHRSVTRMASVTGKTLAEPKEQKHYVFQINGDGSKSLSQLKKDEQAEYLLSLPQHTLTIANQMVDFHWAVNKDVREQDNYQGTDLMIEAVFASLAHCVDTVSKEFIELIAKVTLNILTSKFNLFPMSRVKAVLDRLEALQCKGYFTHLEDQLELAKKVIYTTRYPENKEDLARVIEKEIPELLKKPDINILSACFRYVAELTPSRLSEEQSKTVLCQILDQVIVLETNAMKIAAVSRPCSTDLTSLLDSYLSYIFELCQNKRISGKLFNELNLHLSKEYQKQIDKVVNDSNEPRLKQVNERVKKVSSMFDALLTK